MDGASVVTIKSKILLYKKNDVADNVELIEFEEFGFSVVSQKDIYNIGDKAIFITPDYCISNTPLFAEFIAPGGDESKSYLGKIEGKPRRIRAKKFSLHKGDGISVYSNGILLPLYEVADFLCMSEERLLEQSSESLSNLLGIEKYEEPEEPEVIGVSAVNKNTQKKPYPKGVYKTDETNINLVWNYIENYHQYPITLIGTEKVDGSSISIGINDEYPDGFIASRNINKELKIKTVIGRRNKTLLEKIMFWKKFDLNIYEEKDNDDIFVKAGNYYLDWLKLFRVKNIILRGELNGVGSKGSGNKNNPSAKLKTNIKFFYADYYTSDKIAVKMPYNKFQEFCDLYGFPRVTVLFNKTFNSREEIEATCETIFKDKKENEKKIIEGIVLTTPDCKFSCKYMNNEYDSKK